MKSEKSKYIFTIILALLEIFLTATGLGFYTIGRTAVTVLHIPVFLATTLIGLPYGLIIAGVFGFSSMYSAFSPTISALNALFQNPLISVAPRLMVPLAVWAVYKCVRQIADDHTTSSHLICTGFASVCGVIANAAFVIFSVCMLYPEMLGITDSLSASTIFITNIIAVNIVYEIVIAAIITALSALALRKAGITEDVADSRDRPIRKAFQKWLFLFIVLAFFVLMVFLYILFTQQDQRNTEVLLQEKTDDIARQIELSGKPVDTEDLRIGANGFVMIVKDGTIEASGVSRLLGRKMSDLYPDYENMQPDLMYLIDVRHMSGGGIAKKVEDILVFSFVPYIDMYAGRNQNLAILLGGMLILFIFLYLTITIAVKRKVVQRIEDVNVSLSQIRAGDLDERIGVMENAESDELALGINTTVDALKDTMQEIADKNRQELEFAREVQHSALPSEKLARDTVLPFQVLGSMDPAREVGGDFYDYFMVSDDTLVFVIADVSGKGIPAALFMMTAKTLIKNFILNGRSPAEAMQETNVQLCENNEKGMFVTAWLGVLDLNTGSMEFVNAAHNPPILRKAGEDPQYLDFRKYRRGMVLGGIETSRYANNEITLAEGDLLFLYTDGVTEAVNPQMKLYGEERLLACIEANSKLSPEELIAAVREDMDTFVSGMEQYDDITIVVLSLDHNDQPPSS